jgi:outer membrane immunogenic protein
MSHDKCFAARFLLGLLGLLFAASHSYAQTDDRTSRLQATNNGSTGTEASAISSNDSRIYLGAGMGRFNLKPQNFNDLHIAAKSIDRATSNAWTVFAGYRFNPYLSLEGAYIDFGEPSANYEAVDGNASGNYRVRMSGIAPNLVGKVPVGRAELFLKAGYYFYQVQTHLNIADGTLIEAKANRADLLYSTGLSIKLAAHLNALVEYQRLNARNATDSDALWFTASWRF